MQASQRVRRTAASRTLVAGQFAEQLGHFFVESKFRRLHRHPRRARIERHFQFPATASRRGCCCSAWRVAGSSAASPTFRRRSEHRAAARQAAPAGARPAERGGSRPVAPGGYRPVAGDAAARPGGRRRWRAGGWAAAGVRAIASFAAGTAAGRPGQPGVARSPLPGPQPARPAGVPAPDRAGVARPGPDRAGVARPGPDRPAAASGAAALPGWHGRSARDGAAGPALCRAPPRHRSARRSAADARCRRAG